MKAIAFYVSGHGLGHSARAIGVALHLPPEVPLLVRTPAPEWFWRGELARSFEWLPDEFDCGAVQTDSLNVDPAATLARYAAIAERNRARFRAERELLAAANVGCVVSDIPGFPLAVAADLGIPSFLVANFTWHGIYQPYLAAAPADRRAEYQLLLDSLRADYRKATAVFRTPLSIPMPELAGLSIIDVPHLSRPFVNRREKIIADHRLPTGTRLALLSVGLWGLPIDWPKLAQFDGWRFLTQNAPPEADPYVIRLPYPEYRSQDLTASCDVVVAKAGYGTIVECIAAGTPLLYPERAGFIEQAALEQGLDEWGPVVKVPAATFHRLDFARELAELWSRPRPAPQPCPGGRIVAERILIAL